MLMNSEEEFFASRMLCSIAGIIAGIGAAAGAGSSLLGSGKASKGAQDAANAQLAMYQQTAARLAPFTAAGASVLPAMTSLATSGQFGPGGTDYVSQAAGLAPGAMTEADLVKTPGYQFTLDQGLKATQSNAAARGIGVSGAALKGAATYATGLADKTYLDQFNLQQQRFQNALNLNTAQQSNLSNQFQRLQNTATLGENAAAQTGTAGTSAAATQGQYLNQAGLASAAGATGVGSALNQGVQNYLGYNALQAYLPGAGSGATGGYYTTGAGSPSHVFLNNPSVYGSYMGSSS